MRRSTVHTVATGDTVTLLDGRRGRVLDVVPVAPRHAALLLTGGAAVIVSEVLLDDLATDRDVK